MKRLAFYDLLIALVAISVWVVLVVLEVKVRELWFFKYIFWSSLLALFVAFPAAGVVALKKEPETRLLAAAISILLTPVFVIIGVGLVCGLKIAIGGTLW